MRLMPLADDCGMTQGVTEDIFRCIEAGSLRGTAVIAGGEYAAEAGRALGARMAANPTLRVGVHLNLLEGRCTAPPSSIPLLVDEKGIFAHNLLSLWQALELATRASRHALLEQIERELRAQMEAVTYAVREGERRACPASPAAPEGERGSSPVPSAQAAPTWVSPTAPGHRPLYIDGHLHVHVLPALRPVLESLINDYPVAHVRIPAETRYQPPAPLALRITGTMRRELLAFWAGPLRAMLHQRGVATPDYFIGAFCSGSMTLPRLKAGLDHVRTLTANTPDALVEVMFHPGGFSSGEMTRFHAAAKTGTGTHPHSDAPPGAVAKTNSRAPAYAAFYSSPDRAVEAAILLDPGFHDLMRRYDETWLLPADMRSAPVTPHPVSSFRKSEPAS